MLREAPVGTPPDLGPTSLTWRYLGDLRNLLVAQRAGMLQAMHPAISAALTDHSDSFTDPIGRLVRSCGPILGCVFDADAGATAGWVRDQHPPIRGTDARGSRYHALEPATYYWAHATFFEGQIAAQELFGDPISEADTHRLYAESVEWYRRYGLTMRPVPPDYDAFRASWDETIATVLEPTPVALHAARPSRHVPEPSAIPALRGRRWKLLEPLAGQAGPWMARAMLPPAAADVLGVHPSRADLAGLRALQRTVRATWPLVPARHRRMPRARAADVRLGLV